MSGQTVADLGELGLLERILPQLSPRQPSTLRGPGGDAALLAAEPGNLALSTDAAVEGVHFDLGFMRLADAAWRAVVGALGDLAAVGAEPRAVLLSCGLRGELQVAEVEQMFLAVRELGRELDFDLVGGDLVQSPRAVFLDVCVAGRIPRAEAGVERAGVRAGDLLTVTGALGGAAAGLELLRRTGQRKGLAQIRFLRPPSRVREGRTLAQAGVHAMTDISDGLAAELRALAVANPDLDFVLDAERIPIDPALVEFAQQSQCCAQDLALSGGEDYELLFALPPERFAAIQTTMAGAHPHTPITAIGEARPSKTASGRVLQRRHPGAPERPLRQFGFEHFRGTRVEGSDL